MISSLCQKCDEIERRVTIAPLFYTEKCVLKMYPNVKGREHLRDVGINGIVILKCVTEIGIE
jgi:hypothetical protein